MRSKGSALQAAAWIAASVLFSLPALAGEPDPMPEGFVHLRTIDPSIVQDVRYAGARNFTGRPLPGYEAAECVLARPVAKALSRVQLDLKARNVGLKIFDCYRPAQAVAAFMRWVAEPADAELKRRYHPRLPKSVLNQGYISSRSGHSRGATVDLTLVDLTGGATGKLEREGICERHETAHPGQAELDMGTTFDCFDTLSHTRAGGISDVQRDNRALLVQAMKRHGFRNYSREWWHFTFSPEPYPKTYFDFPVRSPPEQPYPAKQPR